MKLLVVLGEGGHTKEMLRLVDLLGPGYEYSYLIHTNDKLSPQKIKIAGPVAKVILPRWKRIGLPAILLRSSLAMIQSLVALLRIRPSAIIASGPGVAVPPCILAKCLGIKVIFVETGSRVFGLSATGKVLYRFADMFFVQWPELVPLYPRAIYAGRLL